MTVQKDVQGCPWCTCAGKQSNITRERKITTQIFVNITRRERKITTRIFVNITRRERNITTQIFVNTLYIFIIYNL